jgi:hypothetical protein
MVAEMTVTRKCQLAMDEQGFLVVAWPRAPFPVVGRALPPDSMRSDFTHGELIQVRTMCIGLAAESDWRRQCSTYAEDQNPPRCPRGTRYFKVVAE